MIPELCSSATVRALQLAADPLRTEAVPVAPGEACDESLIPELESDPASAAPGEAPDANELAPVAKTLTTSSPFPVVVCDGAVTGLAAVLPSVPTFAAGGVPSSALAVLTPV